MFECVEYLYEYKFIIICRIYSMLLSEKFDVDLAQSLSTI